MKRKFMLSSCVFWMRWISAQRCEYLHYRRFGISARYIRDFDFCILEHVEHFYGSGYRHSCHDTQLES